MILCARARAFSRSLTLILSLSLAHSHSCFRFLSLCAASWMWVMHRSVVIVPPEGGLEFRWDSEMCWCFVHVTIKLVSGTTQRPVIESCVTHVSSSPRETVLHEIYFLVDLDRRKKMQRVCLLDSRCVFLSISSSALHPPRTLLLWKIHLFLHGRSLSSSMEYPSLPSPLLSRPDPVQGSADDSNVGNNCEHSDYSSFAPLGSFAPLCSFARLVNFS